MDRPLDILLVEDSADDATLIGRELAQGGLQARLFRVETAEAMRAALQSSRWDAVIADHSLPQFSALAALRLLASTGLDLPFFVVSGSIDERNAVEAMRAGARDFVMKDNLARLPAALERELREAEERRRRRESEARLLGMDRMASLGQLAAGVAHEIRNPLAYILGNLDLALEVVEAPDPPSPIAAALRPLLRQSHEGLLRVRDIVGDLKSFSRAGEEKPELVDLKDAMEAALKMVRHELRHRARLVKEYGEAPPVLGNAGRLCQVFMNFLLNAAQAIPPGRKEENRVTIRIHADAQGRAAVEISDTGVGIPKADLARVFEPFFTTKAEGTGLGLPLCQKLVSEMGGELGLQSEEGRGTTVTVLMPAAAEAPPVLREAAGPTPAPAPRRGRVLVIDDEPALAEVIRRYLSRWHEVATCGSGEEALRLLEADGRFDAVLSDLMMPEMTGAEFFRRLEALKPGMEKKLAFVTGGAFTSEAIEFLAQIPNPRIEKPFQLKELAEVVAKIMVSA